MMDSAVSHHLLLGALSLACGVVGLFFLKFWVASRDRLFFFFSLAFFILGLNWALLGLGHPAEETRYYYYLLRLPAFLLIAIAIVDKNRRPAGK